MSEAAAAAHRRAGLAYPALVLGGISISAVPLFVRWIHVQQGVGPTAMACWRMAMTFPLFAVLAARAPAPGQAAPGPGRGWLIGAGLFFAGDLTLWHWSLLETSIANSTLLSNLAPVFVALGAAALFSHRLRPLLLLALALAVLGACALVSASFSLGGGHLAGDAAAAGAAIFYAAYVLTIGRVRQRWSSMQVMAWSTASAGLAFALVAWMRHERFVPESSGGWLELAAFALVAQVTGQAMIAFALQQVPPTVAAITLLIQPVLATLVAWPLFDEPVGGLQAVGAVVVLAGILLARRSG
jgi:drug/metabolite transporter (DMT)-like permease